ncbi:MAG: LysO family transporter [Paludibacter sp.]|nr:LysO family transporter [Paludibacter sp.]
MFVVLIFMFAGVITGYLFRKLKFTFVNKIILALIWLLLFLLGVEVGVNDHVVKQFANLGFEALLIAAFGTMGSVVGAWLLWKITIKFPSDKSE